MSHIETLLENESVKSFVELNETVIAEAEENVAQFKNDLKRFVLANPEEFLAESLNETRKNIRTFSEVATAQYMSEVSSFYSEKAQQINESGTTGGIEDYL